MTSQVVPHGADTEVGVLQTVMLHRPGTGAEAAHPPQQRPAALRRRALGGAGPGGARRLRRRAAQPWRRGALPHRPAHRDLRQRSRRGSTRSRAPSPGCTWATPCAATSSAVLQRRGPGGADDVHHGRHPQRRGARWLRPGHLAAGRTTTSWSTRCRTCSSPGDSSVWIRDRVAVTSLAMPARARARPSSPSSSTPTTLASRAPRRSTAGTTSTSRAATSCSSHPG